MVTLAIFQSVTDAGGEPAWQRLDDVPGVDSFGEDDYVSASLGSRGVRAYVNGCRVIGTALLKPGDLVLLRQSGGEILSFQYQGRVARREEGRFRRCAFTHQPIAGEAVCCPCGCVVDQAVAEQLSSCPECACSLSMEEPPAPVATELL